MAIIKCPRCEINFIREENVYCDICKREMKGEAKLEDLTDMCIECGENPSLPGEDLCVACMMDKKLAEEVAKLGHDEDVVEDPGALEIDEIGVSSKNDDIPVAELAVIHKELAFDDILEEEEAQADDEDDHADDMGF